MFKCTDCKKVVRRVEDIRGCSICQTRGAASSIPRSHSDSDWLTPALFGYMLGGGFSGHSHTPVDDAPAFSGGGGDTGGAWASGSWESDSDRSSGSSDSSSSSSDSGSSSSDSGSSSSDSGSSSSGSSD